MHIVAVVNQKGGVAKTTTTANLGACLASRGYRTLLIDLDPQGNLSIGLGMKPEKPPYGLHDVLLDYETAPISGIVRQVASLPLYVVPGSLDLAYAEAMLLPQGGSAYRLRHALESLEAEDPYDFVFIDCPPSLGRLTQNGIVAANKLLIPTEPKFYAFQGMDTLNRMIVNLTKDLRFGVDLLGVLLTMYEKGTRLHRNIGDEIKVRFGDKVFDTVIYKNVRLSEAEVEGQPIVLFDKHARGALNYDSLALEVLERVGRELPEVAVASSVTVGNLRSNGAGHLHLQPIE